MKSPLQLKGYLAMQVATKAIHPSKERPSLQGEGEST